jgi:hypothetical protein
MIIFIPFDQSHYRTFKAHYPRHVQVYLRREFPCLVSHGRLVQLMPRVLALLVACLFSGSGRCAGSSFVDSAAVAVCHNRRIHQHKVFAGRVARGHTSMDSFFGFKLHLLVNDCGELLALYLTPGYSQEVKLLPRLVNWLIGKLLGDKGYLSQPLFEKVLEQEVQLITKLRSNMKNCLSPLADMLLRKRSMCETNKGQLWNISQIEHSRQCSPIIFLVNLVCVLIAYSCQPKNPSLDWDAFVPLGAFSYRQMAQLSLV